MHDIQGTFAPHPWLAEPFFFLVSAYGWLGWLIVALTAIGTIAVLSRTCDGLAWLLDYCFRKFWHEGPGPAATDGRNVLRAVVRGGSLPELEAAALDRARDLYGADANLTVAGIENVATSVMDHGRFVATVYVRRVPGLAPAPAVVKFSTQEASTS